MTTAPKVPSICESSCRPTLTNSQIYGMILRTIPFWVQKTIQIPQPPHMMYCVGTRIQHHLQFTMENNGSICFKFL